MLCLLAATWLLVRGWRAQRRGDPRARGAAARGPGRGARVLAALRLPALAAFGAFTVSAALDGIAALLPPEVPVQAQAPRDCAEAPLARGGIGPCDAAPESGARN